MREIIFRGKDTDTGEWVYGYYVELCDPCRKPIRNIERVSYRIYTGVADSETSGEGYNFTEEWYEVDPDTVGQYIGLKDKNGNKIFKGDILAVCVLPFTHEEKPVTVVFDKNEACFILVIDEKTKSFYRFQDIMECEVIGNVVDNPELLKGGEE